MTYLHIHTCAQFLVITQKHGKIMTILGIYMYMYIPTVYVHVQQVEIIFITNGGMLLSIDGQEHFHEILLQYKLASKRTKRLSAQYIVITIASQFTCTVHVQCMCTVHTFCEFLRVLIIQFSQPQGMPLAVTFPVSQRSTVPLNCPVCFERSSISLLHSFLSHQLSSIVSELQLCMCNGKLGHMNIEPLYT